MFADANPIRFLKWISRAPNAFIVMIKKNKTPGVVVFAAARLGGPDVSEAICVFSGGFAYSCSGFGMIKPTTTTAERIKIISRGN